MAVTLKDIAARAGVSITTVSLVLNDRRKPKISEEVRERVLRIAGELEYIPNRTAQRLVGGKTMTVALLVNSVLNPFFCEYLSEIDRALSPSGYHTLPFESRSIPERTRQVAGLIDGRVCDALISLEWLAGLPTPRPRDGTHRLVLRQEIYGDATPPLPGVSTLQVDYEPAIRAMCEHFVAVGARRPGLLGLGWTDLRLSPEARSPRAASLERCMREAGLEVSADRCEALAREQGMDAWHDAAVRLLRADPSINCLWVHNAMVMPAVLQALASLGRVPGEDIAVATYDDPEAARWLAGGLTVLRERIDANARTLAEMTLRLLGGETEPRVERTGAELVVRASSSLGGSVLRSAQKNAPANGRGGLGV